MNNKKSYFAAANGFSGFRSYFDEIFSPEKYERLYILKGGPGTGKSSFMRAVKNKVEESGAECEEILCSSDPKSLDGIICEKNNKKIAILDGTAPHERDAQLPGAIDEIINLGESWDSRWLSSQREKIYSLCKEKKRAYKNAYSYLSIAGAANTEICKMAEVMYRREIAKKRIKNIAEEFLRDKSADIDTRLITAFSKDGEVRLNTPFLVAEKVFSVSSEREICHLFMNDLSIELVRCGAKFTRFPSVFDDKKTEGVFLHETRTAYIIGADGEALDLSELCSSDKRVDSEGAKLLKRIESDSLCEASRWFGIASDFHFRLEEIYSRSMNFDKNEEIIGRKLEEIYAILEL